MSLTKQRKKLIKPAYTDDEALWFYLAKNCHRNPKAYEIIE